MSESDSESVIITFIIPTIGRESLIDSLNSLLNQDDNNWKAFVIFDNVEINYLIDDNRIEYLKTSKLGDNNIKNKAGMVRNYGLKYINDNNIETEWIGFLDDDDILSSDYISKLKEETLLNNIEVCIFRMCYSNGYILPSISDKNIIRGKVGISFAIKKYISNNNLFENNPFEDYFYLQKLKILKYRILISSFVTYFVRIKPIKCKYFSKILINF
jgi:hypothetical protein